ncbi:MAG: FIVAR domain-containing protein, partial [Bifidobacteriaceae bacterium]|nr:FIVAR domain-containing protein [Bifidobacteriaceae bacterium]
ADYEGWALGFLREGLLQATASVNVDGDVIVGRGIPEDWMSVSKAPIEWKNIAINDGRHLDSLRLNATDARTIELTLTGDNASGDITLNLPLLKENIEGASAGVVDNAKGTVTVPGNTKSLTVTLQRDIREFSTLERPTVTSLAGTGSGGLSLTWDPVQGAEHYVVTVTAGGESSEYVVANGASFTLPAVIPTLSYSLVVKAVGSGLESENSVTSSITLPLPEATTGGELSITTSNPAVGAANPVNLTALGTTDWIKTGLEPRILENYPYLNRKSGVEPAIQRYLVNENPGDLLMQINAQMYFEWTDGVEPQTGSGANYSTQFGSAHGRAFEQSTRSWIMTAPGGDPEGNVLTIYTGAWQASQRIDVYLSDNSAPFQTYEFTVAAPDENKKIDIEYTVPPGVEVIVVGTVTGKTNNSGNIWIPAATLTGDVIPPPVSVPDEADKSTLGALAEEIQALDEAAYSPNSWAVLNAALEHAEGVLADGDASQEEVDRAAVRLVVALVGLIPTRAEAPVSTGALGGIVAVIQARALAESNYTPSSWGPFAAALAAAQAFLKADADPTQMQIDSALAILVGAFAGLTAVPPAVIVDKSVLTSLISQIPSLDEELYSPPSWVAVASALEAAIGVAADPDATQVAVDAATARLTIALAGLIPTQQEPGLAGARAVLARLITDAALLDSSAYTPATWAAFAAALSSAIEAVAVGESVEELYSATSALGSAIARLAFREVEPPEEPEVPAIHADGLDRVAEAASVLTKAAYTETSWALVAEALAHARRVLAEPSPSQGRIDAAAEWLTSAITLLVAQDPRRDQAPGDTPADAPADRDGDGDGTGPGAGVDTRTAAPDTTAMQALLKGLIGDSALFDPAKYTADSWQAHAQALAAAKMVSVNPSATPSEIGAAFAALTKAMIALAPAPETTVRDTPIPAPTAIKVKTAQTAVALVKGKSVTVAAGAYTSTGTKVGATWTSSNMKVATVTASGKITAKKAGKATISVTAAGGKKATIRVTVLKAKAAKSKVAKVALSGAPRTMAVGQVSWIGAKYAPARATSVRVAYASSNPGVAAIDKAGRLVAKAPGKAVLTVKAGGKTAKTTVTVSAAP